MTPEMLEYFSTGLAEQASEGIANRVEDVELGRAEVLEAWRGGDAVCHRQIVLVRRDYSISVTKQPDEVGYVVEGNAFSRRWKRRKCGPSCGLARGSGSSPQFNRLRSARTEGPEIERCNRGSHAVAAPVVCV